MIPDRSDSGKADNCFCGTATVGERGQVVIPADLRKELGLQAGDKLLIWKHPSGKGIMLFPVDSVREFMNMMLATLESAVDHEAELSHTDEPPQSGQ